MLNHIIKSQKYTLDDEVTIGIKGKKIHCKKREIKVYATEDQGFEKFVEDEKIYNFILGFKLNEHVEIIKVYSSSLQKERSKTKERLCFELEIDLDENDEKYKDSVVKGLIYQTLTMEKNGAIKFYSKESRKNFSLRDGMAFEYKNNMYSYDDEFDDIKVYNVTKPEELLLHEVKKDNR